MDAWVVFDIISVAIGFLMFGTAFYGFMKNWKPAIVWGLCLAAFVTATVIPVIIALAHASTTSM